MQSPAKIGFVSLGCPKALVDSEQILTDLQAEGYQTVDSYQAADVVVVNTCGFIDAAKQESLETIGEALDANGKVIVTGCMGANAKDILDVHPGVIDVSGPQAHQHVVAVVKRHFPQNKTHNPYIDLLPPQGVKLTPGHYAYLKISEGCNHRCSFCIIPSMRGKLVSRPVDEILQEANVLLENGVKELLVISQDTSAYGVDLKYRTSFFAGQPVKSNMVELAAALATLGESERPWIRMHYVYPYPHVDNLIPLMADGLVLPYLDVPFQHGSNSVLKAMRRPGRIDNTLEQIQRWRSICPEISIRSTFIVGFPGETDEDFAQLLSFIEQAQLDRVGAFTYSPVAGAAANQLEGAVDEDVKEERYQIFMQRQQAISQSKLANKLGNEIEVIVDHVEDEHLIARSKADAPEIDGLVYLPISTAAKTGDRLKVKVTDSDEYDLWAEPLS